MSTDIAPTDIVPTQTPKTAISDAGSNNRKRRGNCTQTPQLKKKRKGRAPKSSGQFEGSNEEVLLADVQQLLSQTSLDQQQSPPLKTVPYETEVTVTELSSTGDGIGLHADDQRVYVVPFSLPGDTVRIRVFKHDFDQPYSLSDFLEVTNPSPLRDDSRVRCQYFAKCSGCQFQMMDYSEQLKHKKTIVERAYRNFSGIDPSAVPAIQDTMPSPLQFGYRTKLTPHFDGPPGGRRDRRNGNLPRFESVPPIGFMQKGTRHTIDIEDCLIGTDAVRQGMKVERTRVVNELEKYHRGATILLRENTRRVQCDKPAGEDDGPKEGAYEEVKTCETNQTATTTEYIGDYIFQNPAGAFFQNNNSILLPFTEFVGTLAQPLGPLQGDGAVDQSQPMEERQLKYLVDAYSGSGLFTITLSRLFSQSVGIDISSSSIEYASKNARLNGLGEEKAMFLAADAVRIFDNAIKKFPADETVVVIDPPRKGCDIPFLRQLINYGPARVVYVSCNVHTQARDVGVLVNGLSSETQADRVKDGDSEATQTGGGDGPYRLVSLRGMDFFPQTGHVEGVAVLVRKE